MIPHIEIPSFRIGSFEVQPFGVLVVIGIVMAVVFGARRARRVGLDPAVYKQLVRLSAGFGIFGSHVVEVLAYHPEQLAQDPWCLLKFWQGMSSFGGFFCAFAACLIYLRRNRIPILPYADVAMFGFFPGAWFFGRMGCSIAHDHPGRLSDFFLAVQFPGGARHDMGLYEWLLCFLWIPFLYWLGRKQKVDDPPPGSIFAAMAIAYSVPRFFLDFLRATDVPEGDVRYAGLTFAQYGCVLFVAGGVWFFLRQRERGKGGSGKRVTKESL